MPEKYAVVVTTINPPTRALNEIAVHAPRLGAHVIVIGDEKSPENFTLSGVDYYDLPRQRGLELHYPRIAPARHYARKNVGYLVAMSAGATIIIETDDDNIPLQAFWNSREIAVRARPVTKDGWVNAYAYFTDEFIWPRGLPLDTARDSVPKLSTISNCQCAIQQGLADGDPDVDAIYRLLFPLPFTFKRNEPIALSPGTWCPFNSQNTTWWRGAFPLLYLPYYCSFRMTDIWRSFVAQRIAWENDWTVLFHNSTVFQERNEHNLMRDFTDEVPGYLNNGSIGSMLASVKMKSGTKEIPNNMRLAYQTLIEAGLVRQEELNLLDAWLNDIAPFS